MPCPQVLRQVEWSAQRFVSVLGHVTPPTVQRRVQEHVGAAGAREKAVQQNQSANRHKPRRKIAIAHGEDWRARRDPHHELVREDRGLYLDDPSIGWRS